MTLKRTVKIVLLAFLFSSLNSKSQGFIQNIGQVVDQHGQPNADVLFILPCQGMNIVLKNNGFDYELFETTGLENLTGSHPDPQLFKGVKRNIHRVEFRFKNQGATRVETGQKLGLYYNYYTAAGDFPSVPIFSSITYTEAFPKTDVICKWDELRQEFKYDIVLRPGAKIADIEFLIHGADKVLLAESELLIKTSCGDLREHIPISYYLGEEKSNVEVRYALLGNSISFMANPYPGKTFVIDPASKRLWGTYYGDAGVEYGQDVAADANGNAYLTGYTLSNTNIATTGTYQTTIAGSFDAFIAKFNASGVRQWGTYFGGNSVEASYAITIANTGAIYISGDSFSTSGVASVGAHQTVYGGGIDDVFLGRFDANGQRIWSTYYGGILHDISYTLTTDINGNPILAGHSESPNNIATPGSFMDTYVGGFEVFVAKFNPSGVLQWGTYYGDVADEEAWAVACDNAGNIYCTGFTASTSNFSTVGTHQVVHGGGTNDAYVFKLNPAGTSISWCTYYGGSGLDVGTGLVIFPGNEIILSGNTASSNNIASNGAYQLLPGSADDAFLVRLDQTGNRVWGTYFGGNDVDYFEGMVRDIAGNILLCGSTLSTNQVASSGAWQPTLNTINNYDAFMTRFSLTGSYLAGTYYGGSSNDNGYGISTDANGAIYICGTTTSSDSIASAGSHMSVFSGVQDAFLARFCMLPTPSLSPSGTTLICVGDSMGISTIQGPYSYLWNNGSTTNTVIVDDTTSAGTYTFFLTLSDGLGCSAYSDTSIVVVDLCNTVDETVSCTPYIRNQNTLHFCDASPKQVILYSVTGQHLYESKCLEESMELPLPSSKGIYLLYIVEQNRSVCIKWLVN